MPKAGYKQSPEHKRKRAKAIEGEQNPAYKDGRRSYRRKAGAKPNDGTVVHHKNGDRTNNDLDNLERLTDGDRKPGRNTTPKHERITQRAAKPKDGCDGKGKDCECDKCHNKRSDAYWEGFTTALDSAKLSKTEAAYQSRSSSRQCQTCRHYTDRRCSRVEGSIAPRGTCRLWTQQRPFEPSPNAPAPRNTVRGGFTGR